MPINYRETVEFPYQSFDYVVSFLTESCTDPQGWINKGLPHIRGWPEIRGMFEWPWNWLAAKKTQKR